MIIILILQLRKKMKPRVKTMPRILWLVKIKSELDSTFTCSFPFCVTPVSANLFIHSFILFYSVHIQTTKCLLVYLTRYSIKDKEYWCELNMDPAFGDLPGFRGPFLWHAQNVKISRVLIVSRLPCSSSASLFSAPMMFRCLIQGLPELNLTLAAKSMVNEVITCSLCLQKEPGFLIAFLHPPSTSFPHKQ